MIYLDTSVALAQILSEDRFPPAALWESVLVSSRLLEYEIWTRVHARHSHGDAVRGLLSGVNFLEMAPPVLSRALEPFPLPVRTLDALHLASVEFLRSQGRDLTLASYDDRMVTVAKKMGVMLFPLP